MKTREKEIFERQRFSKLKQRLLVQEQQLKEERHRIWLREKESIEANDYPQTKQYFELLDYLRLLTLEYIERYLLVKAS